MYNLKIRFAYILPFLLIILTLLFGYPRAAIATNDLISSWSTSTQNLPYTLGSHVSVALNNRLFIIGGATGDDYDNVFSSTLNNDGSLSAWNNANLSVLPETRFYQASVQSGNNTYLLGGAKFDGSTSYVNTVYLGKINPDGSISSWQALTPLPDKWGLGAAAIVGDRLYFAGGFNNSGKNDKIYYATINSDGTIGAWTTSSVTLPEARYGFGMVAYQNNLIILGGQNATDSFPKTTYKTSVNLADGSLSAWQPTTVLSTGAYRAGILGVDKKLFIVGGVGDGNTYLNTVRYGDINSDGTLGPWQTSSNTLPQPIEAGAIAYNNGYLYLTGGYNGSSYLNTVYYAKINSGTVLPVPLLKQTDPLWANNEYDNAHMWSPGKEGIDRWGCALTSAAMMFQYYNITKLPDGQILTPATLNEWLKLHSKSYIRNGFINWVTISSLSKLAKSQNPGFSYDMLEFNQPSSTSTAQLTDDLAHGHPDILEEPGHFIIATGTQNNTYTINDPYYNRTLLSDYSDTFQSTRRYIPANSDGSYIELFVDATVNLVVKDKNGNSVGQVVTEQPLTDDTDGHSSGAPIKVYYVQKPASGDYYITISSQTNQNYHLESDLFNQDAQDVTGDYTGVVSSGKPDTYHITFDKLVIPKDTVEKVVTFASLFADIEKIKAAGYLFNTGMYTGLKAYATLAQTYYTTLHDTSLAKNQLANFIALLNSMRRIGIQEPGYQLLLYDANYLKSHL